MSEPMADLRLLFLVLVLVLVLAASGVGLFAARRRLVGQRLRLSLVATGYGVITVVLVAWLVNFAQPSGGGEKVLLLTDPPPLATDPLSQQVEYDAIYQLYPGRYYLADPAAIRYLHPDLTELTIQGYGLSEAQLRSFSDVNLRYQPTSVASEPVVGLVDVAWSQQLLLGETLTFDSKYQQPDNNRQIKVVKLFDPSGQLVASTRVVDQQRFSLTSQPKALGHFLYRVQVSNDEGEIEADLPLPVEVRSAAPVRLLVVQSAPSFEAKQLKNWAAEQGAALLLLTTISTDRLLTQTVNFAVKDPPQLGLALYQQFDVMIMDARTLKTFSDDQQQQLQQGLDNGLGLLLLADDSLLAAGLAEDEVVAGFVEGGLAAGVVEDGLAAGLADSHWTGRVGLLNQFTFTASKIPTSRYQPVIPTWPGSASEISFDYLPLTLGLKGKQLTDTAQGHVLVNSEAGPLSVYHQQGLGHIGVSLMTSAYRWRTAGDLASYSGYYQYLFNRLARPSGHSRFIGAAATEMIWPLAYRQTCLLSPLTGVQLTASSPASGLDGAAASDPVSDAASPSLIPSLNSSLNSSLSASLSSYLRNGLSQPVNKAIAIPLSQSAAAPYQYCGFDWPSTSGWHQLTLTDSQGQPLDRRYRYVFSPSQWQSQHQQQRVNATVNAVAAVTAMAQLTAGAGQKRDDSRPKPMVINPIWYWLLLMVSSGLLWLEEKLS